MSTARAPLFHEGQRVRIKGHEPVWLVEKITATSATCRQDCKDDDGCALMIVADFDLDDLEAAGSTSR